MSKPKINWKQEYKAIQYKYSVLLQQCITLQHENKRLKKQIEESERINSREDKA